VESGNNNERASRVATRPDPQTTPSAVRPARTFSPAVSSSPEPDKRKSVNREENSRISEPVKN
jgi:hypothetical protein